MSREVALVLRRTGERSQRGHRHICRQNELTCVVDMFCILVVSMSIFWLWYCYYSFARYHLWKKLCKGYMGLLCIISYNCIYLISKKTLNLKTSRPRGCHQGILSTFKEDNNNVNKLFQRLKSEQKNSQLSFWCWDNSFIPKLNQNKKGKIISLFYS